MFNKKSEPVAPEYDLMSAAPQADVNAAVAQVRNVPMPIRPQIAGELVDINRVDDNCVVMKVLVYTSVPDKSKKGRMLKTAYDRFTLGPVVVIQ